MITPDVYTIMDMFSFHRPRDSEVEQQFIDEYLTPLGFRRDEHLNLVLTIGENPRILFSSHFDTVGRTEGYKELHYDGTLLTLSKQDKIDGFECLGADDTAGVWLMTEMVKARIPGVYVIHYAEESGCIGSSAKAKDEEFFKNIKIAIAFDRMGTTDVITHQCSVRTASDAFALALAEQLGGGFIPDDSGVYTDTNEYAHIVPECTNISVGYYNQHGQNERQDVPFLIALRDTLMEVDWDALPVERDPDVYESLPRYTGGGWMTDYGPRKTTRNEDELYDLVRDYPDIAALILASLGVSVEDFEDQIYEDYGRGAAYVARKH